MCRILIIAGYDPSGGAGILADVKAVHAHGGYALGVVTALTVQNTRRVNTVKSIEAEFVHQQVDILINEGVIDAVKIGLLPDGDIIQVVADLLARLPSSVPVVLDPVLSASCGASLVHGQNWHDQYQRDIVPRCTVMTPNAIEAGIFSDIDINTPKAMIKAAKVLLSQGPKAVLVTGGHVPGPWVIDILCSPRNIRRWRAKRLEARHQHGTGCVLASTLATLLARGYEMEDAVAQSRRYIRRALKNPWDFGSGCGAMRL